ncbi:MAG: C4-dicarboxylate ABC transporter substrate-binding protein [Betaproteobacteria bacterium]|nr:C4-dicarboxylate ABC transporter substrate-binding protein [Betaproteobacteria bacterium]
MKPPPPIKLEKIMRLPRWLLWLSIAGVLALIAGFILVAFLFVKPAPPRTLHLSTGPVGSDYHALGQQYQKILARHGVAVRLIPSAGSPENLERLTDGDSPVDAGFFQGGTGYFANAPQLVSLGSLYYEPLWVFYRGQEITDLPGLSGKRIAIGPYDSGSRALAIQLLAVNSVVLPPTTLVDAGGGEAAKKLLDGQIDAALIVAPGEFAVVQQLLAAKNIRLLSFDRAEAYTRRFPYLTKVLLPKGVLDFTNNFPAKDVVLVAPTASLLARETLHPALAYLLLRAATEIHSGTGLFNKAREFPNMTDSDFPYSDEVTRFYQSGSPFLQRHLPFWLANLVERLWVLLLPALAIAIPLIRSIPPLFRWWRRSRIYRWYARLKEIELDLESTHDKEDLNAMLGRLDEIEEAVSHVQTPLAYAENLYNFRANIAFVRQRVLARAGR